MKQPRNSVKENTAMQNIPLFKIYWDDQDIEKVTSVIKKGMYCVKSFK